MAGDPNSPSPEQLRLTARVHGNTIKGYGPAPGWNSGVWINCGVAGDVSHNFVSDFAGTTGLAPAITGHYASATSHGRFVPLQQLTFEGNVLSNNGQHSFLIGGDNSHIVNSMTLPLVEFRDTRNELKINTPLGTKLIQ